MSRRSEDFSKELIYEIFRTHPMWNYSFYLIVESFYEENFEAVGIGFKKIKVLDKDKNEYVDIDNDQINDVISIQKYTSDIICENGMTHDGLTHKFIDDFNNGVCVKRNVLIMEIEKNEGEFKDRLEKCGNTITSVKRAWVLENICLLNCKTSGFDAISNEIFIKSIKFASDDIKILDMPEEIAREKAKEAVSKLF